MFVRSSTGRFLASSSKGKMSEEILNYKASSGLSIRCEESPSKDYVTVLLTIPHFNPDFFAGNYHRIFELLTQSDEFDIQYSAIEFFSLSNARHFISKFLGYNLPFYTAYSSKGYGSGSDERRFPISLFNTLSIKTSIKIRHKGNLPHLVMALDIAPSWVLNGFIVNKILRRPYIVIIQLVPRWITESKGSDYISLYSYFRQKEPFLYSIVHSLCSLAVLKILSKSGLILYH